VGQSSGSLLATDSSICDVLGLRLANLELWLDARRSSVHLRVPAGYEQFVAAGAPGGGLTLRVCNGPLRSTERWQSIFCDAETWQLWRDGGGRYVFAVSKHSPPPRQVAVELASGTGEVLGEFGPSEPPRQAVYPLQDIDIVLFSNWLAESGDVMVHAAGIDDHGAGYAFVGPAAAGKSTLVAELASRSAASVLGEDQVVVRYQEGRFRLYGTPWHTNPARCSPGGVPLQKLFFLDRAAGHGVQTCGRRAGIERLLQDAFIPYYNRPGVERILDTLPRLVEQVPFYTLGFQIGADVMKLIREA
jgi:hypothetical protein